MSDQSKFIAGLLLGAAAGAALAYLLTTDRGKEIVEEIKTAASEAGEEVKAAAGKIETELNEALEKGRQWASDLQSRTDSFTS
ncbi:MAG: YtxH domain-containing protein [Flavipsychrobacter sp.]|jgi:gas vesicle protein|nr:YtxH domain-containing protein [Flavipsychrobacter sp.]